MNTNVATGQKIGIFWMLMAIVFAPVLISFKITGDDPETVRFYFAAIFSTIYVLVVGAALVIGITVAIVYIVMSGIFMSGVIISEWF